MATTAPVAPGAHGLDVFYDGLRNVLVVGQRVITVGAVWEWQASTGWVQPVSAPTIGSGVAHFGFDPVRNRQVAIVRRGSVPAANVATGQPCPES